MGELVTTIHYNIGHFDIYQGVNFERAVTHQIAFLQEHFEE